MYLIGHYLKLTDNIQNLEYADALKTKKNAAVENLRLPISLICQV